MNKIFSMKSGKKRKNLKVTKKVTDKFKMKMIYLSKK